MSCDGVISGIPGRADLFFFRVIIETVKGMAGSWRQINMRGYRSSPEDTGLYLYAWCDETWSISVVVMVIAVEYGLVQDAGMWGCSDI